MLIGLHGELVRRRWEPRGYAQTRAWGEVVSVPGELGAQTLEGLAEASRARVTLPTRSYHPRHLCSALRVPLVRDPSLTDLELVVGRTVVYRPQAEEGHEWWSISHGVSHVVLGSRGNHSDAQLLGVALMVDAADVARAVALPSIWRGVSLLRRRYRHVQSWALLVRVALAFEARGIALEEVA